MTEPLKKPQTKALAPIDEIRGSIARMEGEFAKTLPSHIDVKKFMRVTMTAIQNNPSILGADRSSLYSACMKAAQDGLLPDGREAALVPYGQTVQYMPMIGGLLKKARNSGEIASINAVMVYTGDEFEYWIDERGEHIKHKPNLDTDRGQKRLVYATAQTKDGGVYIEVMTQEQVMAVRNVSRSKGGPWSGPFEDEMWRKTALRRLTKRLPSSTDLDQTLKLDEENYDLDQAPPAAEPPGNKPSRLAKIIETKGTPVEPPAETDLGDVPI
jgi:recombination protein RecT